VSLIRYDCVGSDAGMRKAPDGAWVRHCDIEAKLREARVEALLEAAEAAWRADSLELAIHGESKIAERIGKAPEGTAGDVARWCEISESQATALLRQVRNRYDLLRSQEIMKIAVWRGHLSQQDLEGLRDQLGE